MNWKTFIWLMTLATASFARAISPTQLRQEITNGAKLTIIDVRNTEVFQRAHIPGAINVPAALCGAKKLPPLGRVIVYDEGLGDNVVNDAAAALNAKPGIRTEILEGGFAGWEALNLGDTRARGAEKRMLSMMTYQQLKTNATDDIVLVDLRKTAATDAKSKAAPLTDLQSAFPQARVTGSPFNVRGKKKLSSGETAAPLLVLVDQGDGTAEEMARTLRANGVTRFAILAGGEEIIARQGQPGSKRSGLTIPIITPTGTITN